MGFITNEETETFYAMGDILAKNCFALFGVIIKHRYLRHLNADDVEKARAASADKASAPSVPAPRPRVDRRPSVIMMNETNTHPPTPPPEEMDDYDMAMPTQVQVEMGYAPRSPNMGMNSSTNEVLVRKATAALEPLCGRLCRYAGQPGFKLDVDYAELEKMRLLCDTVLRLTSGDLPANDDDLEELPDEMRVNPTMGTTDAMKERQQLPLFTAAQRQKVSTFNKQRSTAYAKVNSPACSPAMSPASTPNSSPGQASDGWTRRETGCESSPPTRKTQTCSSPKDMAPTRPRAPDQLARARQARQREMLQRSQSAGQVIKLSQLENVGATHGVPADMGMARDDEDDSSVASSSVKYGTYGTYGNYRDRPDAGQQGLRREAQAYQYQVQQPPPMSDSPYVNSRGSSTKGVSRTDSNEVSQGTLDRLGPAAAAGAALDRFGADVKNMFGGATRSPDQ